MKHFLMVAVLCCVFVGVTITNSVGKTCEICQAPVFHVTVNDITYKTEALIKIQEDICFISEDTIYTIAMMGKPVVFYYKNQSVSIETCNITFMGMNVIFKDGHIWFEKSDGTTIKGRPVFHNDTIISYNLCKDSNFFQ